MTNPQNRLSLLSFDVDRPQLDSVKISNEAFPDIYDFMLAKQANVRLKTGRHVVLIGGGIVGLLSAFYLSLEGFQVTILEKKSLGAAASGRNGGGILALGRDLHEIAMIQISIDLWEQLSAWGIPAEFVRNGHAMVAMNDYEASKLQKAQEIYHTVGLETNWLERNEALKLLPDLHPQNAGALFSPRDAQGYPFHAVTSLVQKLKSLGVRIIDHCEVIGFQTAGANVAGVVTDQGPIQTDEVVLCTGPWTSQLGEKLGVQLPVSPRRSQIMVTEIVNARRVGPFVSGNNLYLRQTHAGNILFGGGGPWEISGYDVSGSADVMKRLSTYFVEMFPGFKSLHLIRSFAGTVELTADHKALFGAVEGYDNLSVSAGYSGHGFGMSAFAGKLLAKQLAYKALEHSLPQPLQDVIHSLSPSRFHKESLLRTEVVR